MNRPSNPIREAVPTKAETQIERRPPERTTLKSEDEFVVMLWDQSWDMYYQSHAISGADTRLPERFDTKEGMKERPNVAFFHLTDRPRFSLCSDTLKTFSDTNIFFVFFGPGVTEGWNHWWPILQNQSYLYLVLRVRGNIPQTEFVPEPIILGGAEGVRRTIERMWPSAPRFVEDRAGAPEGWHRSAMF